MADVAGYFTGFCTGDIQWAENAISLAAPLTLKARRAANQVLFGDDGWYLLVDRDPSLLPDSYRDLPRPLSPSR
jgi:hypothetical protein